MAFRVTPLAIAAVLLVETDLRADARGFFRETYKRTDFAAVGIPVQFVQDNHSRSGHGVLRGLHYQKHPHAQGKLVTVTRGEIFDVAVDIRRGSPTYGRWVGVGLSDADGRMLYVPEGFAHGFCVLSDVADVLYKATSEYAPSAERGVVWNDPALGIAWPIATPVLSGKDAAFPPLARADNNLAYAGVSS